MATPDPDHTVDQLLARARAWAGADPDPATRAQLQRELDAADGWDADVLPVSFYFKPITR